MSADPSWFHSVLKGISVINIGPLFVATLCQGLQQDVLRANSSTCLMLLASWREKRLSLYKQCTIIGCLPLQRCFEFLFITFQWKNSVQIDSLITFVTKFTFFCCSNYRTVSYWQHHFQGRMEGRRNVCSSSWTVSYIVQNSI